MGRQLIALTLILAGCAPPSVLLDPRSSGDTASPEGALLQQYGALADRLQATAAFYEHEERKNHHKLRAMSVLTGIAAGGAGGTIAALAQPGLADEARPGIASLGLSLAAFAGLFAVLPHAHGYIQKEAGYRRKAQEARAAYAELDRACSAGRLADPTTPGSRVAACLEQAQAHLVEARRFAEDTPGKPPPDRELDALIRRGQASP